MRTTMPSNGMTKTLVARHKKLVDSMVPLINGGREPLTDYEQQLVEDAIQAGRVTVVTIPIESYEQARERLSANKFYNRIKK